MTMLSAGDLAIEIDYVVGNPSGTLQRLENGDWQDYCPDGGVITSKGDKSNQNLDCHVPDTNLMPQ